MAPESTTCGADEVLAKDRPEFPELPRLIIPFKRTAYARLRQLIDFIKALPDPR
jgi:hypothetical protein